MATLFPANPTLGDTYTIGTKIYQWSGFSWVIINQGDQVVATVTATNIYVGGNAVVTTGTITGTLVAVLTPGPDISIDVSTTTDLVVISNTSTLQTVTDRGNSTDQVIYFNNTSTSTSTNSGAVIISGGVGIGGEVNVQGRVTSESLKIADTVLDSTVVNINTTATTIIDTYSALKYRAAKYLVQIDSGTGPSANFQVSEILLIIDNVGVVSATEYAPVTTGGDLGTFSAEFDISTNNVNLYFTPFTATAKAVIVMRTGMAI